MTLPYKIATLLYCFNEQDEALLLRRKQKPNLGLWSPCGGKLHMDDGESPYACACREAGEEIGLNCARADLHLTGIVSEHGYEGQGHWLMFLFEVLPRLKAVPPRASRGGLSRFSPRTKFRRCPSRKRTWSKSGRCSGGIGADFLRRIATAWPDGNDHELDHRRKQPWTNRSLICRATIISWAKRLRQAARAYAAEETPVGAVIVREGRIIARAFNQVELLKDATAHAEMLALTQAEEVVGDWRLTDCTLYVTKEPCPMCAGAMVHVRLARVVFGAGDPKAGAAGGAMNLLQFPTLNHRCEITRGVREAECRALLQEFFAEQRAKSKAAAQGTWRH